MRIFHCEHCEQLVFFENTFCVNCGHALAYLPDEADMGTFMPHSEHPSRVGAKAGEEHEYRFCANYTRENICNWVVPNDDPNPYCQSCRLTRVIPDLSLPGTRDGWARLEAAKRRLVYSLLSLNLPVATKAEDPQRGLGFEFLAELPPGTPGAVPILTGHENGVITINVAEADDAEREKRRLLMHEGYRTILGHFRHEIGHYYWDRLIRDSKQIEDFRRFFGDERQDYDQAIQHHHLHGAPPSWAQSYVSAYASAHPWEDWAETWAHYLHIIDTLETAVECGLTLRPKRSDEPALKPNITVVGRKRPAFDQIIDRWFPLTYVLNNLNRGMGLQDAYPFVLPVPVVDKLRFIHEVIGNPSPAAAPAKAAVAK